MRGGQTEADKDPGDTADVPPRPGVVWKDQTGDKPEVGPNGGAGGSEDPPAGSAAGSEHPSDRQYGGVLGIVRPPVGLSPPSLGDCPDQW